MNFFYCLQNILSFVVYRKVLLNLMHLGLTVLTDESVKGPKKRLRPKDRHEEERYEVSRWVPLLRDLAEVRFLSWERGWLLVYCCCFLFVCW